MADMQYQCQVQRHVATVRCFRSTHILAANFAVTRRLILDLPFLRVMQENKRGVFF